MAKFEKGQSGNPAGRPKNEQSITPWLRRVLAEKREGKTHAELVARAWITAAELGDVNAIKALADRVDGKVTEPVDLTSGGEVFTFTIQRARDDADSNG